MSQARARRRPVDDAGTGQRRHRPDYTLLVLSAVLLVAGLVVVYAISPGLAAQNNVTSGYYVSKQLIAILMGIVAFIFTSQVPLAIWKKLQWPLLAIAAAACLAVRFVGEEVNGAYRWIQIGGLSFQPVELFKFILIIWAAGFLADKIKSHKIGDQKSTLQPLAVVLGFVAVVVAWMQSDLGSTGVIVAILGIMIFIAGVPLKKIALGALLVVGATTLLISTSAYRRDRLLTYMNPERDCLGSGYQACQALIAVGSGGILGRGLANSGQAFGYLPESANDSIFAIMSEKFGFIGMGLLLVLFGALFSRMKRIVDRAPDPNSRLIAAGVLAWFSTQAFINIGAMLGLLPLKGITLPFISYGGTSVVFVMAAVGLIFHISRYTTFASNLDNERKENESATDWRGNRRPYYAASSRR